MLRSDQKSDEKVILQSMLELYSLWFTRGFTVIALAVRRVFSLLRLNIATICACNPYEFRSRTNMKDCQSPVARSNGNEFITLLAATSGGLRGVHAWQYTRGRKLALSVRMNTVRICTMTVYC